MTITIGIDLGTTNSIACYDDGNGPRLIEDAGGASLVPSVVAVRGEGELLIGSQAQRELKRSLDPKYIFSNIKRQMGRKAVDGEGFPFQIAADDNGKRAYVGPERLHSPEELSAAILRHLKEAAERSIGKSVSGVVVTVPAGFGADQIDATEKAAKLAGFSRVHVEREPDMAALAYGVSRSTYKRILVFDFGGGTFDATLLRAGKGRVQQITTNGNPRLGGLDFDKRIREFVCDRYYEKYGRDLRASDAAMLKLLPACEEAKRELTESEFAQIDVPRVDFVHETGETLDASFSITRQEFEGLVEDLVTEAIRIVLQRVLDPIEFPIEDVGQVLMVGGMTRVPMVRRAVAEIFGEDKLRFDVPPDRVVALGAALQGAINDGRALPPSNSPSNTVRAFGIAVPGNRFQQLIPAGSPYEKIETVVLTTAVDEQPRIPIIILEGEEGRATDQTVLARHDHNVTPGPKGSARIKLEMAVDGNGIPMVVIRDLQTHEVVTVLEGGGV